MFLCVLCTTPWKYERFFFLSGHYWTIFLTKMLVLSVSCKWCIITVFCVQISESFGKLEEAVTGKAKLNKPVEYLMQWRRYIKTGCWIFFLCMCARQRSASVSSSIDLLMFQLFLITNQFLSWLLNIFQDIKKRSIAFLNLFLNGFIYLFIFESLLHWSSGCNYVTTM